MSFSNAGCWETSHSRLILNARVKCHSPYLENDPFLLSNPVFNDWPTEFHIVAFDEDKQTNKKYNLTVGRSTC